MVELLAVLAVVFVVLALLWRMFAGAKRDRKNYERSLKMVPMLIHLPPSTDDIQGGGRDERDVTDEQLSEAQVMYSIIASTLTKGLKSRLYGQRHLSFEIVAHNGTIKYYAVVPAVLTDPVQQAVTAAINMRFSTKKQPIPNGQQNRITAQIQNSPSSPQVQALITYVSK